jgi:hypothetical protein
MVYLCTKKEKKKQDGLDNVQQKYSSLRDSSSDVFGVFHDLKMIINLMALTVCYLQRANM